MDKSIRHSLKWVLIWILVAAVIAVGVRVFMGSQYALEFAGCYLLEFSLSLDNIFVFLTIFASFNVPEEYQHRCLSYGIIGAVVLRLIFIVLGVTIVQHFTWVLYIFGFLLIYNGGKMLFAKEKPQAAASVQEHRILRLMRRVLPITPDFVGHNFFTKENGKLLATPLLAVLVVIESSDIIFAIDSVPASFSVSTHMLIIYIANICAILGLRQLFFVVEHMQSRFSLMKYGVAVILIFTGVKLALLIFDLEISIPVSIAVILAVLLISIIASVLRPQQDS